MDMGLANLRRELMKEIKKTQNNVEEEVVEVRDKLLFLIVAAWRLNFH